MEALQLAVPATAGRLPRVRGAIANLCEALRLDSDTVERIQGSVTEACANCVQHAYDTPADSQTYLLEARVEQGELIIRVRDHGRGIDDVEERRLDGGFGLEVIEGLSDHHEISRPADGGTCVVLRFAIV